MANLGAVRSISQVGTYEPFDLQVARGQITGHSTVNIYGYGANITTATIPAWENASAYTFPATATTMNLASTVNTGGDLSGTTILIQGLDSTYTAISETLALTGTTVAVTTKSYLRINNISVASVTAGAAPTGVITLKDLTNTTTYAQIAASFGRSQMSIYTVPAGNTFYLSRIDAYSAANGNTADYITYSNTTYSAAGVVQYTQQAPFVGNYHAQRVMPRPFLEKTDIVLRFKASANTYTVAVAAEGYLVKNAITGTTG
jgi:hypothetical protein